MKQYLYILILILIGCSNIDESNNMNQSRNGYYCNAVFMINTANNHMVHKSLNIIILHSTQKKHYLNQTMR